MDWLVNLEIWINYWTSLNSKRKKILILDPISSYIYRVRDLKETVRNLDYKLCREIFKTAIFNQKANTNKIKLIIEMLFLFCKFSKLHKTFFFFFWWPYKYHYGLGAIYGSKNRFSRLDVLDTNISTRQFSPIIIIFLFER